MDPKFLAAITAFLSAAAVYSIRRTGDAAIIALVLAVAGCVVATH